MVQNIGGYSRSYGAGGPRKEASTEPSTRASRPKRPLVPVEMVDTTADTAAAEKQRSKRALEQAVGAVVGLALDGQPLPVDVAHFLLNKGVQSEVVGRAQVSIRQRADSGISFDPIAVAETLSSIDETVVAIIKQS